MTYIVNYEGVYLLLITGNNTWSRDCTPTSSVTICSYCFQAFPAPTIRDKLLLRCLQNDYEFVSAYLRKQTDGDSQINPDGASLDIDWQFLMDVAFTLGHSSIVEVIQQSGEGSNAQVTSILYHRQYHR